MDRARKLNRILASLFDSVLQVEEAVLKQSTPRGLSITEIHTLEAIGVGRPKIMTHVAAALRINISTLTAAINKLVAKDYVRRLHIPEDRRIVALELTKSGIETVRNHEEFYLTLLNDALSGISDKEAEKFLQSLDNINEFMIMRKINPLCGEKPELTPDGIYQGGMGIGISMGRLAAAVAICGGVGMISAAEPGYLEADYKDDSFTANIRVLKKNVREAREAVKNAGGKGLIGVNILCSLDRYEDYVNAALDAGAQMIVSGGGVPTALPGICRGREVKLVPVVSSARAASVIIRNWKKKHGRTPDALILEGPLAGGYLGFKEEQLGAAEENFYKSILEVKTELEDVPGCRLIVGGGIYGRQDAQKALACGADGVQLGSRFVTTVECDAHENFKKAYINCGESDIMIIKNPAGMPSRVIKNKLIERIRENPEILKACITEALIAAAKGDVENGLIFCGAKAYKAVKIETVKDIFDEFTGVG